MGDAAGAHLQRGPDRVVQRRERVEHDGEEECVNRREVMTINGIRSGSRGQGCCMKFPFSSVYLST